MAAWKAPRPTKAPAQVRGLKEIPQSAFIIKNGNRTYLFSGMTSKGCRAAAEKVSLIPSNIGNTTNWAKVA